MKPSKGSLSRAFALWMIAALMSTCLPCAALAEGFMAVVTSQSMSVAADAKGEQVVGSLPKNTVVTVKAYAKGVAKIQYRGKTGYARVSDMESVESAADKAVTAVDTRIYKKANGKGGSQKIDAGTGLYVLAVKNGVAMVVRDGKVGYVDRNHLITGDQAGAEEDGMSRSQLEKLKKALEAQQKKEDAKSDAPTSLEAAFKSGKYSNEQLCFLFLVKGMGYNTAAAAGVLANINYESGFRTGAVGDGGTSYGICQWHASRRTRLSDFCKQRGLKADSLAAQLMFLKYELETYYPSVHRYLKGVSNDAEGAYKAAYYFCYNFESPASKSTQSAKRGSSAQNTFYPRYAKI